MSSVQLSPTPIMRFYDNNNNPLVGGQLFTYQAGTTTPAPTYTDSTALTANPNPVIMNARGEAPVWMLPTQAYKLVLEDAAGNTIWTVDNITAPAPVAVGNMTDEKGSGGQAGFVAGVDFVAGTTASLTLSGNYGSASNLWVAFDAAEQGADTFSLNGTTLTFNAPIPVGVNKVYVKGGTTLTVGTPGVATVTDATVAANAAIQSTKLSFLQAGAGAIARTVQSKERDIVSVMDFGADPTGATDSLPAFVAAKASIEATGKPGTVYIPNGVYKISGEILNDRSSNSSVPVVSWRGAGSDAVTINYTGTGILFGITGNATSASFYGKLSGMAILGTGLANTFCFAPTLCSFFHYEDIHVEGFDYAFYCQDIDHTLFEMMTVRFNQKGFFARENPVPVASSTLPNQLTFVQCEIGSNTTYGMDIEGGAANAFIGCQFEFNGASNPSGWGLQVNNAALQGGPAIIMTGCYFESNNGAADVILTSTAPNLSPPISDATYVFNGCNFNRVSNVSFATNNILTNFGSPSVVGQQILVLTGCSFKGFNSYVPSAGRPYINFSGVSTQTKNNFFTSGNIFQSALEAPTAVQNPAKCYIQAGKAAAQTIPNSAQTSWAIDTLQSGFSWSTAIAGGGITIPEAGVYHIDCTLAFSAPVGGAIQVNIFDGAVVIAAASVPSGQQVVSLGTMRAMSPGDLIGVTVAQTSGASQTLAGGTASFLTVTKMIDG